MPEQSYIRSAVALSAVQLLPPTMREGLVSDPEFREEFGLSAEVTVTLGVGGVIFQRSALFNATRSALGGESDVSVDDNSGRSWQVTFDADKTPQTVSLIHEARTLVGNHLVLLSPDSETRLQSFRAEANRVNLPSESLERWQSLLRSHPLEDDEFVAVVADLANTPTNRQTAIAEGLSVRDEVSLDLLVPRSIEYFERLVGRHEDGQSLEDFLTRVMAPHLRSLVAWKPIEGYQLALTLASHGSIAAALGTLEITAPDLIRVQNWLADMDDPLSRAADIEASLGRVQSMPEIKEPLAKLVDLFVAGPTDAPTDSYRALSALIRLVYGQLAMTRLLVAKPPYWRRLAAIAQAVLILRAVTSVGDFTEDFVKSSNSARAQSFLLQCFVDMRTEPRWIPEFAMPQYLWNHLGGRVLVAAHVHSQAVTEVGWAGKLGSGTESELEARLELPMAFMPGPLEGGNQAVAEMEAATVATAREELTQATIAAASFLTLANSPFLRRIPDDLPNLAADALARADYRLEGADAETPLVPILMALANVASATRSHRLADTLFIVLRVYRRAYADELAPEDAFRIAMIASASRAELSGWCQCVGLAMNDLAFQNITIEQAVRLHSLIENLCHLVPELWATCGQAEAALRIVIEA